MNVNKIRKQHDKRYKDYMDFREAQTTLVREHLTKVRETAGLSRATMGRLLSQKYNHSFCYQAETGVKHGNGKVVFYSLETLLDYVPQYEAIAAKVKGMTAEVIKAVAANTQVKPKRKYTRK